MTTTEVPSRSEPVAQARPILNQAIERLLDAAQSARSEQAFFKESLSIIGGALHSPYAALEVRHGAALVQETYEPGWTKPGFWKHTVEELLTDTLTAGAPRLRLYRGRDKPRRLALLSAQLGAENGETSGALALVAQCSDATDAQRQHAILSALCLLTTRLADSIAKASRAPHGLDPGTGSAMRKAAQSSSLAELAHAITNRLRTRDGCDHVALGLVERHRVRVIAISGIDDVAHQHTSTRRLEAAMEECLDARAIIVEQSDGDALSDGVVSGYRLHKAWQVHAQGAAVASVPLMSRGACVAILSVRRARGSTFSSDEIRRIQESVEPYAPTLEMVERATRTLGRHALAALRPSLDGLTRNGAWVQKSLLVGAIALCAWLATSSVEYRISTPAVIAPVEVRHVSVPTDGVLRAVHVKPGDQVAAGNVLFEFDTSALALELARLRSELALSDLEESRAVAGGSPVEIKIARAKERTVRARIELVEQEIRNATITAPTAGVVSGPAQEARLGDAFTKGAPLCEISSSGRWLLELAIPESDVSLVHTGTTGRFSSLSRPEDEHRLQVLSVEPSATQRHGATVFMALASTDVQDGWVRPGMAGVARLDLGERPAWWTSTHRFVDYLRFKLWI